MRYLAIAFGTVALVFMLVTVVDLWSFSSLKRRASLLKPGATRAEVQKVLGRPTSTFMPYTGTNFPVWLLSVHAETWAYGSTFDLHSAFHGEVPLHLRLFRPDANDVAVVFGASGRVSQVIIP